MHATFVQHSRAALLPRLVGLVTLGSRARPTMYCTDLHKTIHFTCKACMVTHCVYSIVSFVLNQCIKRFPYLKASLSEALSSHVLCMLQLYTAWKKGHSTPFIAQYLLNIRMANVFVTFRYFSLIIFRM